MLGHWIYLLVGFVVLVTGADALVRGSSNIARRFGVSALVIGLTVVAFGTSAPELFVSLTAAAQGTNDVAIGNVVGSNIFNILMIIGITAILSPIKISRTVVKREMPIMLFSLGLMYLFSRDLLISRWQGAVLFFGILAYLLLNYILYRRQLSSLEHLEKEIDEEARGGKKPLLKDLSWVILGLAGLIWGADLIVQNATIIARSFGISELVIGVTLIAIGTSLPELATTAIAAFRNEADLAVGNAVGSNIFNVFCVIGLTALVSPLPVAASALEFDMLFMLFACFLPWPLMALRGQLGRIEGIGMLLAYVGYVVLVFSRMAG
jgi:cation:H+ antiporter